MPLIAVDFDGTIVEHMFPAIGPLKAGVKEALTRFRELGYELIIYSCRGSKWYPEVYPPEQTARCFKEMVEFLHANEIPFDMVDDGELGKPFADYYIDDRAVRFENNWDQIKNAIEYEAMSGGAVQMVQPILSVAVKGVGQA
ncbi:MAG: Haloacid dehalogenase domain protein hydrolase type 3 [Acidobacteriales bacterium]|nr:Haloacid dehalogenase domain protein hydrolase type 3 [Terriglobales bacterium]